MGRPDLITFDCYGTLIDWRSGVLRALRERIPPAISTPDEAIFAAFGDIESRIESGEYRSYREVLTLTAGELARHFEWPLAAADASVLADSLPRWMPFPEVNAALERLRAHGHRLGILSNVDDDLLAETRRHFRVEFDVVVTAQQVCGYKPGPDHFRRAIEIVGGDPGKVLHIAQSYYHDVQAAVPLGIRVIWVNRDHATIPAVGPVPDLEVEDLAQAVEALEGASGQDR